MPDGLDTPLTVLIVDDNTDLLVSQGWLIENAGYRVRMATTAIECLTHIEHFVPDVVLLDLAMPIQNGFELSQRLRAHPNCARSVIVAHTGYGDERTRAKIEAAGFDAILVKPVEWRALQAFLEAAEGKRALRLQTPGKGYEVTAISTS